MKVRASVAGLVIVSSTLLAGCSPFIGQGAAQKPPEGPVPNVVGKQFEAACKTLRDKNYLVAYSPTRVVERGDPVRVLSQSPKAGEDAGPSESRQAGVVKLRLSGAPPEDAFDSDGACLRYNEMTIG